MKYQQSKQSVSSGQFGNGQGLRTGTAGDRTGFRPVSGQIISSDSNSITVKQQDGSSRIVLFTDKTAINKANQASTSDLKVGETVAVVGQQNSDGSVTAQNIQINPIEFRGGLTPTPSQ
jgi:hypothetical protein